MRSLYDSEDNTESLEENGPREREITLGTSTILGIFFALALICAVFFGFGYSLGRKSAEAPVAKLDPTASKMTTSAAKPAPGSPENRPSSSARLPDASESDAPTAPHDEAAAAPSSDSSASPKASANAKRPTLEAQSSFTPGSAPASFVGTVLQVAAVSHQEDADLLLSALKRRGYDVVVRHEPQDKLLHVQIGPFPSKKDAEDMKKRLLADGYNAIVK